MKKRLIFFLLMFIATFTAFSQLVDISYTVKTVNVRSYENDCDDGWLNQEEYTAYLSSWDNINTTETNTGCQTCTDNGCTYAQNITLQTRTNNAYTISFKIDAFEDDECDRCTYNSGCCGWLCSGSDDCRRNETQTLNIRQTTYPSNSVYTNTPTWGSTNNHQYTFQYTWKYSGSASALSPTTSTQNAAYTSGALRSWSVSMTAGRTYRFSACGTAEDTRIIIYSSNGYTQVANVDDNGPECANTRASVDFTPCTSGTYYIELSHTDRTALTTSGNLSYYYYVPASSTAPTGISGTTTICNGIGTTLTQSGGSLGTFGVYKWYTGSCGGTLVGTGPSITVSPSSTTTYYVRAEDPCSTTGCASVTVSINSLSVAPTSITGTTSICAGLSTTLTQSGGSLGTGASYKWYTGSCDGTLIGTGSSITVTPGSSTTYYVRAEGTCNITTCASVLVTVNTLSTAPSGISVSRNPVYTCDNSVNLTVSGGGLGSGASWKWYSGGCGSGTSIGSGTTISVTPSSSTTYFVRAEGPCPAAGTACVSTTITVNNPPGTSGATGAGFWNVSCYNGNNFNTYYGNYTENNLNFNTTTRWSGGSSDASTETPSAANAATGATYTGCPIPVNNHSYIYKRQNFTCGIYKIDIGSHDDDIEILVDNVQKFIHPGCCDNHTNVYTTFLTSTSTVEVRMKEGTSASYCAVSFNTGVPTTTAATAQSCATSAYQANWTAVGGATKYYLDIDDNSDFSSMLVNNLDVGNVTSYYINFPAGGTYWYRVRAYNSTCGITSGNSNVTSIVTASLSNDFISNARYIGNLTAGGATISVADNNIGASLESGEPTTSDYESSDETDWLYFTTSSTPPTSVQIDGSESDWLDLDWRLYKLNDASYTFPRCSVNWSKLTYVTDGNGDNNADLCTVCLGGATATSNREVSCLDANSTYYIVVYGFLNDDGELGFFDCNSCNQDQGNYTISLDPGNAASGPDAFCSSREFVTIGDGLLGMNESFTISNQSNRCADDETNEPGADGDDESVWYKFTTASTVGTNVNVSISSSSLDAYVGVFISCNGTSSCPTSNLSGIGLTKITEAGNANAAFNINDDPTASFVPRPNTIYYVQVDGYDCCGLGNSQYGDFSIGVSMNNTVALGNDHFCSAWTVGNSTQVPGTSEQTNNDILDLGETITVGTFNNKTASAQEDCAWDEPNNDDGDETVWFKLVTSSTPGTEIDIDVNASNGTSCFIGGTYGWLRVYEADGTPALPLGCTNWTNTTNWFDGITATSGTFYGVALTIFSQTLGDNSKFRIECPKPSTTYYLQIENAYSSLGACDMSDFTMTVKDNGIPQAPNDRICNATALANPQSIVGTYTKHTLQNQNNFCATNTGEPTPSCFGSIEQPVWYKLPAASAPGASDISNPGRKVAIVHAYSEHAAGDEDEINLQLALYTNSNIASCPTNPTTGFTQKDCNYVSPLGGWPPDPDAIANYGEFLTAECLTPATDYYMMVDGEAFPLGLDFGTLKQGWFEFDVYYPREIGDLPCSAVPFKLFGNSNGQTNGYDNATGNGGTGDVAKTGLTDYLYNNSNLCTTYTPGTGANLEPPTTFTTGDGNDNPGWVYFFAPPSGSVKITATADPQDLIKDGTFDNIDLQLAIFEESTPGSCSVVRAPQSPTGAIVSYNALDLFDEEMYVNCLKPGKKYYLMIDASPVLGVQDTRGIFDLHIEDYAPNSFATNDELCGAIAFTDTYGATAQWSRLNQKLTSQITNTKNWCADNLNEPGRPVLGGYNETGVWYKFIAPPSGKVHILAENTDNATLTNLSGDPNHIDLSLAVYKLNNGYACTEYPDTAAMTLIQQDYDNIAVTNGIAAAGTTLEDEEMEVECLVPGQEYYLLVSGKKSAGIGSDWDYGRFDLYLTSHPRNPASWDGSYSTVSSNQYLPTPQHNAIDVVCDAANLGTMPAGTAWYQPFADRKVPQNCGSNYYMSPPFNNFCATATGDPTPGYQQDLINVFGGNNKPVWFKFTTPAVGAYETDRISVEVEAISGDCDIGILDDWYDSGCTPSDEEYQDCINLGVSVWLPSDGTCTGTLYEMDSDFDIDVIPSGESAEIHCLDPSTTYYIMIDGASINEEGNFNVRIQQINPNPRPVNNFICDAKKLTTGVITSPSSFWGGGAAYTYEDEFNICADTRLNNSSASGTEPIPSGWDVVSPPSDANDMTNTVWYTFRTPVAPADYAVQIDVNSQLPWPFGDLVNPKIAVWEAQDNTCAYSHPNGTNMVEMASEYDPLAFWGETIEVYCLKPNTQYYVQVGGTLNVYGQDQGYFDITINDIPAITVPDNDAVCDALNVGTGTLSATPGNKIGDANNGSNNYHNYCTDLESGEPVPDAFDPDNTVWFKFTTPATANKRYDVTINANSDPAPEHNDGINLQLALYESSGGCTFTNFTEIASDFDGILWDETLTATCLKPSTTYYIQVDGTKGLLELFRAQGFGYFGIEVITDAVYNAPANDNVCNATGLGTVPVAGSINNGVWYYNNCATVEAGEPVDIPTDLLSYDVDKSVWFTFTAGRDADYKIELESEGLLGDAIDLQVAVYRATNGCSDFTGFVQEDADYDAGFIDEDLTLPCLKNGQLYYVQVDGSGIIYLGEGKFKIRVIDQGASVSGPANDNICSATNIAMTGSTQGLTNQTNVCATIQAGEPNTPASVQKSVWYKFQAPASGRVKITTHDADGAFRGLDPEFYVYEVGAAWDCNFANWTTPGAALGSDYNPIPDVPVICPNCGDEEVQYECFIPGWWYAIQVDGTTVGGPQGNFDITIEDLLYPYTILSGNQPGNNDIALATDVTSIIRDEQCVVTNGNNKLQGTGTWTTYNYGKPTRALNYGLGSGACSIDDLCGDTWYKFTVPGITCGPGDGGAGASGSMPVYTPIVIQGSARYNANFTDDESKLHVIAYKGTAPALTAIGCGTAGKPDLLTGDQFFNFELSEAAGTVIYLQVFGEEALDWNKDFDLCVSERKGFDECIHAAQAPPMQYGVEYCYNIKGASSEPSNQGYAESCPLTGIPGLPDPDSDAPTENSVYFKFVTDNTCADYKLTFKYYFTTYSALNNKGISYSIYKDATPCDGAPASSGTLDCQSFYNSNAGSYSYEITYNNNMYLTTANGIDTSSTYYIQIDGPGQTFGNLDGTIKIDQLPVCFNFVAIQYNDTSAGWTTCGDGWQHYHDGGTPKKYLFSLYTNGNANLDGVAKIFYDHPATTWDATKQHYEAAQYVTGGEASWVMRRYWDFVITSGNVDPSKPVKVRFYYIDSEKQAVINAMNNFFATYGSPQEGFEWFKSKNTVQFNPNLHINPSWVTATYGSTSSASGVTGAPYTFTALDNQLSCNNVRYVELSGIPGFSGGSGATGNGPALSPLPIELISFTGYHDSERKENILLWSTASEYNNEKFIVEKSVDAINFTAIGEVNGHGTTIDRHDYLFIDEEPWQGNNYYRLTQVDYDGSAAQTNIINIVVQGGKLITAIQYLYPNPTTGDINVYMTIAEDTRLKLKVYNVIGEIISTFEMRFDKGEHVFLLPSNLYQQGAYFLQAEDLTNGNKSVAKFVKQ